MWEPRFHKQWAAGLGDVSHAEQQKTPLTVSLRGVIRTKHCGQREGGLGRPPPAIPGSLAGARGQNQDSSFCHSLWKKAVTQEYFKTESKYDMACETRHGSHHWELNCKGLLSSRDTRGNYESSKLFREGLRERRRDKREFSWLAAATETRPLEQELAATWEQTCRFSLVIKRH